jgi:hypothetical protein
MRKVAVLVGGVVVLVLVFAGSFVALRSPGRQATPEEVARTYFLAWGRGDFEGMRRLVADPPGDFTDAHRALSSALRLGRLHGHWRVRWSPATLHPSLLAGGQLEAAADQAVRSQAAALVAVRPSTGEVLAVADRLAEPKDAFQGLYPPGSTFKVITAADLLHGGMTPGTSVDCRRSPSRRSARSTTTATSSWTAVRGAGWPRRWPPVSSLPRSRDLAASLQVVTRMA